MIARSGWCVPVVHAPMVIEELAQAMVDRSEPAETPRRFEELFHAERTRLFGALWVLTGKPGGRSEVSPRMPSLGCGSR